MFFGGSVEVEREGVAGGGEAERPKSVNARSCWNNQVHINLVDQREANMYILEFGHRPQAP